MQLAQGRIVSGRYQIIDKIGAGGMSIVYRAKDLKLDRFVTLKVLREEHVDNDAFRERFKTEARAVAAMNQPNIVNVYDVGSEDDINYIVMEFINGETLKDLILKRAPFDNEEVAGVSMQIAAALSHAHKNGVIHRDIKPQNILLTHSGVVKVADFGIARSANGGGESGGGSTLGSVHYISPEQAKGGVITVASDLYSLGVLMFEMATAALPFDADSVTDIALMHLHDPFPDARAINEDVCDPIARIIHKLTQKAPESRYADADALMDDLRRSIRPTKTARRKVDKKAVKYETRDEAHGEPKRGREPWDEGAASDKTGDEFDWDMPPKPRKTRTDNRADEGRMETGVIIAAIATALLVIAIVTALVLPRFIKQPTDVVVLQNMVGVSLAEAQTKLGALGVTITAREEYSNHYDEGYIIGQDMPAETKVPPGSEITVIVSKGEELLSVPDFSGMSLGDVYDGRHSFTIIEASYDFSDEVEKNHIIEQSPKAGTLVRVGEEVRLSISKGAELKKVIVPDIVGMLETDARAKVEALGLRVGAVNRAPSDKYEEGRVAAQTPIGGREAFVDQEVMITVSTGKPEPKPEASPVAESAEPAAPSPQPAASAAAIAPSEPSMPPVPTTQSVPIGAPETERLAGVESVVITISKKTDSGFDTVFSQEIRMEDFPINFSDTGVGRVEYQVYVNSVYRGTFELDFRQ